MSTDLVKKLLKNTTIDDTSLLEESKLFTEKDMITTVIPMLNVAFSAKLDGGFVPGLTMWAGPSKHFKTLFALIQAQTYMKKYPDSVFLFYVSEFGSPEAYFKSLRMDTSRIVMTPLLDVEQLKHDVMNQLNGLDRGDKVFVGIDSIGNLASRKEVNDAIAGEDKADFTRAKQFKSLFRMVTPHLTLKDIPMSVVNHTYKEMTMHPRQIVGGGTGGYYSSDTIFIVGRQQEQDKEKDLTGYNFIINVEKSRYVREKSKIPIEVRFDGGVSPWSGLLEVAIETGHVTKPKAGYYLGAGDKAVSKAETDSIDFWRPILTDTSFQEAVTNMFAVSGTGEILSEAGSMETIGDE